MKKVFSIILPFFLALIISQAASAQVKIGFIDPAAVFASMPEVKAAENTLAAYQDVKQDEFNGFQKVFDDAYDKFIKDSATLTPAVKEARRKELQDKYLELNKKKQEIGNAIDEKKDALETPLRNKLMKAIKDVAKEGGFAYILTRDQGLVLPDASDVTKLVRKKLGLE